MQSEPGLPWMAVRGSEFMKFQVRMNWLVAFSVLTGGLVSAQDHAPYGPGVPVQPMSGIGAPYSAPMIQASGAVPFSSGYDQSYGYDPGYGGAYCPPTFAPTSDLYAELLPQDRGGAFACDSRFALDLHQMFRGAFFRMEYLQGSTHHSGGRTLGTPIDVEPVPNIDPLLPPAIPIPGPAQDVANVANQFLIIFEDHSSTSTDASGLAYRYAQAPTTDGINWRNVQGVRGSFGIPVLDKMSVEGSFTVYATDTARISTPPLPVPYPLAPGTEPLLDENGNTIIEGTNGANPTTFLVTTLTTDGVPGSRVILYDSGFFSQYDTRYIAGNVDLVFNWKNPEIGFRAKPIFGYQHQQYQEGLAFGGFFNNNSRYYENLGVFGTPQSNYIGSSVTNLRDLVHLGMRNEIALKYVTFGVQEKIGLGANLAKGHVITRNLREPGTVPGTLDDPDFTDSTDREVVFAPSFDLDVYASIQVTRWMNFRVGYSFSLLGNVATADQSFTLNEVSDGMGNTTPDVVSRLRYGHRSISSLTLGGEIILP